MSRWSDDSACWVVHYARLCGVLDTVVISSEDVYCSVVFGTLVSVSVFSVILSELLMTYAIGCPCWSSVYECQRVEFAFTFPSRTECSMLYVCVTCLVARGCAVLRRYIHVCNSNVFSVANNWIEHWVHLRCSGIHLAQYTDTKTSYLHTESGLTTHTGITPPYPSDPCPSTIPTPHPHHRNPNTDIHPSFPYSNRIGKSQTQFFYPLHPHPPHPHRPEPNIYTFYTFHHLFSSHVPHSSIALQMREQYLNHVYHPHTHTFTTNTPPPSPTPVLPSLSHRHTLSPHSHATQITVNAS